MKDKLTEALKVIQAECNKHKTVCLKCPLNEICETAPYEWEIAEDFRESFTEDFKGRLP